MPTVAILYHPYGPGLERRLAAPIPDYVNWTGERMERDLDRIEAAGIDVVLVAIDLADIASADRRERYESFFTLASRRSKTHALRLALWVDGAGSSRSTELFRSLLSWGINRGLVGSAACYRLGSGSLLVAGPGLAGCNERHPAITLRRTAGPGAEWSWSDGPGGAPLRLSSNGEQVLLRAGLSQSPATAGTGRNGWLLPRRHGKTLAESLRAAATLRPQVVCISSWNDFATGDFVEPNTLDQKKVVMALEAELRRLRRR